MNKLLAHKIELFRRGYFDRLGLFDRQIEAMECLTDTQINDVLYGGGVRGGKTKLLTKWKLYTRLAYHGSVGMTVREEKNRLKDTTMKTFKETLDEEGLIKNKDYTVEDEFTYHFANGSMEMFREMKFQPKADPEFDRVGSYDLTDVAIDEGQQIHFKAYNVFKGRLSLLNGVNEEKTETGVVKKEWNLIPKIFISCNPSKNWLYTKFYKPYIDGKLDSNKAFISSLATDNPYIDESYIEQLKTADKETVQRLLFGNWDYDDDPSLMCEYDAVLDMFTNTHVKPTGKRHISADLAMSGRDRFVGGHFDGRVGSIDIDMEKSTGRSIELSLKDLKDSKGVPNSRIVADADGLGAYLESYIKNIKPFHGGQRANNPKDYANLKSECAFKLAELINKREIHLLCTEDQQEEIATQINSCLKRKSIDQDTMTKRIISKEEMKDSLRRSPDYLDFLIMGMYFEVMPNGKPKAKVKHG